VLRAIAVYL